MLLQGSVAENLLGLLYIRNATASYRAPLEPVPDYLHQAVPYFVLLMAVEWLVLAASSRSTAGFSVPDALCSMSQGLQQQLVIAMLRGVELTAYLYIWTWWRCFDVPWNSAASFWATMLGVDFCYYWFHRASHEVNLVWSSHQVHHSSEHYNLTTALRQSVVQTYFSWSFYLPLALIGVPPSMFLTNAQFNTIYQFWIHTQLVRSLGPLEHVLNTPSHHRVHHGSNPKYLDRNYAGVLIVWDRLFGTFCWEQETPTYGLVHNIQTYDMWSVQLAQLRWTLRDAVQQPGAANKLRRLLHGPGWSPGTARLGDPSSVPEPDQGRPRFERASPVWLQLYVAVHFSAATLQVLQLSTWRDSAGSLLLALLVTLTLSCLGWLMDRVWFGPAIETLRCCLCLWLLRHTVWLPEVALTATRALFTVSILLWITIQARHTQSTTLKANIL